MFPGDSIYYMRVSALPLVSLGILPLRFQVCVLSTLGYPLHLYVTPFEILCTQMNAATAVGWNSSAFTRSVKCQTRYQFPLDARPGRNSPG